MLFVLLARCTDYFLARASQFVRPVSLHSGTSEHQFELIIYAQYDLSDKLILTHYLHRSVNARISYFLRVLARVCVAVRRVLVVLVYFNGILNLHGHQGKATHDN